MLLAQEETERPERRCDLPKWMWTTKTKVNPLGNSAGGFRCLGHRYSETEPPVESMQDSMRTRDLRCRFAAVASAATDSWAEVESERHTDSESLDTDSSNTDLLSTVTLADRDSQERKGSMNIG